MNTAQLITLLKNNDPTLDAEVVLWSPGIGTFDLADIIGRGKKELLVEIVKR